MKGAWFWMLALVSISVGAFGLTEAATTGHLVIAASNLVLGVYALGVAFGRLPEGKREPVKEPDEWDRLLRQDGGRYGLRRR